MNSIQIELPFEQRVILGDWMTVAVAVILISLAYPIQLGARRYANNNTTVRIAPATQLIEPGDTTTTEIWVEDVNDLFGYEFEISFDTAVVHVVSVAPGDFLDSGGFAIGPTIDNASPTGTVEYAYTQLGGAAKTGSGPLTVITWEAVGSGTSPVRFQNITLGAPGPVDIPVTEQDGEITVTGGMTLDYQVHLPLILKRD